MSDLSKEKWLTAAEAGERLFVDGRTVRRWIDEGYFPNAVKTSPGRGHYRIPESDIIAFEKSRKVR